MKFKKVFWGLFFILAAALVVVNQMGIFTDINLVNLVFSIFLVAILLKSLYHISFAGILFSLAFLGIIYAEPLGIESIVPWPILLAAFFGSIGLTVLFGCNHRHSRHHKHERDFVEETIESEDNVVDVKTAFGATTKYINNKNLEKINISCSFGAAKVYLDNAELKDDKAVIDLDISFSGVELYIPKEWRVINNADVSLGGIDEKTINKATSEITLTITGKVSLAGVEIIYI